MKKKEGIKKYYNEFKEFIMRGNVLDLAVGVIIGAAFGKIVTSVVNDILMPIIGIVLGGLNFSNLSFKIGDAVIKYGSFLQNVVDFLITAFCIFIIVKLVNKLTHKKEEKKPEENVKAEHIILLEEIRDILKNNSK